MSRSFIQQDPGVMGGIPCFAGTRVPVRNLFDYLEEGSSIDEFLVDFPTVSREAAVAVIESAKRTLLGDALAA